VTDTAAAASAAQRITFYKRVLDSLRTAPGLKSATFASGFPPYGGFNTAVELEGRTAAQQLQASVTGISTGYFETLGIPLLRGDILAEGDVTRATQVAVVNQTLATRFFPAGENPIGKSVRIVALERRRPPADPWVRIVGVVADVSNAGPRETPVPGVYIPFTLVPSPNFALAVWTATLPRAALPTVRARVAAVDKDQPLAFIRTLEEQVALGTAQERFTMVFLAVFAAFGLALAAIGIYGAISYSVSQRTREVGIRMALGADARDVIRLVVAGGFRLAFLGILLGVLGSVALMRMISTLLYGVTPTDPLAFGSVAVLLCLVGLAACYIPARRATRVSPVVALRV
jgi:putative ABC transport system permease protein